MMADDQDQAQKTEDPTPRKLEEARKKGDAPKSQEVNVWFGMAAATAGAVFLSDRIAADVADIGRGFFARPHDMIVDGPAMAALFRSMALDLLLALGGFAALVLAAALAGNLIQQAPVLSTEKMQPKLSKLSPISGAKRLFGAQGLVNFIKGLFKIGLVSVILAAILWPEREALAALVQLDLVKVLPFAKDLAIRMMACVLAAMTAIAALDYAYQRWEYMKRQRMTKQEVKDEFKQSEGDPTVKAKIRQVRQERSRRRMMAAVPEASVVIANPTHYAVALQYEAASMAAPALVAKGTDLVAKRIRDTAEEHDIPLMHVLAALSYRTAKHLGDTGLAAMRERGRLREGMVADIVVFDPAVVTDNASYTESTRPTTGIDYVLVGGRVTVDGGRVREEVFAGEAIRFPPEAAGS